MKSQVQTAAVKAWQNPKTRYGAIAVTLSLMLTTGLTLAQPAHKVAGAKATPKTLSASATPTPSATPSPKATNAPSNTPAAKVVAKTVAPVARVVSSNPIPSVALNLGGQTPSLQRQAVADWFNQNGILSLNALYTDFNDMNADASLQNVPNLQTDCSQVYAHATTALGYPVIPDSQINSDWVNAMTQFQIGAASCQDALSANPAPDSAQKFEDAFNAAANYLDQMQTDLSKL